MIHASGDNDIQATPIGVLATVWPIVTRIAAVLGATRNSVRKVDVAHASRCNRAAFLAGDFQDTSIDPSDATGIASWQPDLPFFMQNGFGRR